MPSTVIKRFDHSPETSELLITFTTGRRYVYSGVPEDVVRRFAAASSRGAFFNRYIRDQFDYRELAPADAGEP